MNPVIAEAVTIFREFPNASDVEILSRLVEMGCERVMVARLVEFIPMAYCRVLLADSGVRFSDSFRRKLSEGSLSANRLLEKEPLWAEVVSFAKAERRAGVTGKALLVVAAHSAEFNGVNQLANQGSKLEHIVLTPIIFQWSDDGPTI
jgi:hypothetical protein